MIVYRLHLAKTHANGKPAVCIWCHSSSEAAKWTLCSDQTTGKKKGQNSLSNTCSKDIYSISKIFPLWLLTFIVSEFWALLCHIGKFGFANSELMLQLSWCSRMKLEIMTNTSVARSGSFGNLPNRRCGHNGPLIRTWIVRGKKAPEFCLSSIIGALTPTHRSRNSLWRYLHEMSSLGCFLYIDMFPSSLTPSSCQFL